jgi:hypothetical protein
VLQQGARSITRRILADCDFTTARNYEGAPHGLMFTHTDRLNADVIAFANQ